MRNDNNDTYPLSVYEVLLSHLNDFALPILFNHVINHWSTGVDH